jgi:hypothetical protein
VSKKTTANHFLFNVAANISLAIAFWAIYQNKNIQSKDHFTSLHSKIGLAVLITSMNASVFAFVVSNFPSVVGGALKAKLFLKVHGNAGMVIFLLFLTNFYLGMAYFKESLGWLFHANLGLLLLIGILTISKSKWFSKRKYELSKTK